MYRKTISCTATNGKSGLELPCQNTTDGFEISRKQFYTVLYSGFLSVSGRNGKTTLMMWLASTK
jgi:hypothetical protein